MVFLSIPLYTTCIVGITIRFSPYSPSTSICQGICRQTTAIMQRSSASYGACVPFICDKKSTTKLSTFHISRRSNNTSWHGSECTKNSTGMKGVDLIDQPTQFYLTVWRSVRTRRRSFNWLWSRDKDHVGFKGTAHPQKVKGIHVISRQRTSCMENAAITRY